MPSNHEIPGLWEEEVSKRVVTSHSRPTEPASSQIDQRYVHVSIHHLSKPHE
jgi:hypothetical protein